MTIASKLSKMTHVDLINRIEPKVNNNTCHYPGTGTLGAAFLDKVRAVFIESVLPDDDDNIPMVVRNRDDARWGLITDSVIPYKAAETAVALGLLDWDYAPDPDDERAPKPRPGEGITAGMILVYSLQLYTEALVDVLCEAAVKAYEEGPDMEYVAIINVPGYSPWAEENAEFATIKEAWEYLADERRRQEDENDFEGYTDTVRSLGYMAEAKEPICDSVYGSTPGYEGDHDLGMVYTVTNKQD